MMNVHSVRKSWQKLALVALMGGALVACGGGGGGNADPRTGVGVGDGSTEVVVSGAGIRIGSGTGAAFVQGVPAASSTSLQAGGSTTISVNFVTGDDNRAVDQEYSVEFTSDCVANGLSSFSSSSETTVAGLAESVYTAEGCSGSDEVTVRAQVDGATVQAALALSIEADQVLAVQFESVSKDQISLAGIGGEETAIATFKLLGQQSAPIIGEDVRFTLSTDAGGITIADGSLSGADALVKATDREGKVSVVVQSGTVATSVDVIATHVATGIQGRSEGIIISTGVPVQSRFSISASEFNPAEAATVDGIEVQFSVIASDQFGNDAPDGTRISFVAPESGNIDDSCTLVSGRCTVTWISSNPRPQDSRISILAHTSGAEDFVDVNGNNVYEGVDVFPEGFDLPEAYADINGNGTYDLGEYFVDANENGVRDLGDGQWNGPCMTGILASALCPGEDSVVIFRSLELVMPFNGARIYDFGSFPQDFKINVVEGVASLGNLILADSNTNVSFVQDGIVWTGNALPQGTVVSFSLEDISEGGKVKLSGDTSYTLDEATTLPNGFFGAEIVVDATSFSGTARLILKVAFPSGDGERFVWDVSF